MTVVELNALHARYVRIADRFKAIWTWHQFASGAFRNLLGAPVPYAIEFGRVYDSIKHVSSMLNSAQASSTVDALDRIETMLVRITHELLEADDRIAASTLRRFFEKLKRQDDDIIQFLIKFYCYADAVEADRRDKLDFLFTRLGEDYAPIRGEYVQRDGVQLRARVTALVSLLRLADAPQDEVGRIIKALRTMRDDIGSAVRFDDIVERNLVRNSRAFKHRIGDLYFHPDVLMAVIASNIAAKNRYLRLYAAEEPRLIEETEKLVAHGSSLERNFGGLANELAELREQKERFDAARAASNVKSDIVVRLKASMNGILAQLDRGLDEDVTAAPPLPESFFDETRHGEEIVERFGRAEPLLDLLQRIAGGIGVVDVSVEPEEVVELPCAHELRLESWEVSAYQKLFGRRAAEAEEDGEELWLLYLRAAALRIKVDEEATMLAAAAAAGVKPEPELLARAEQSLELAKTLDEQFGDLLQEAAYYSSRDILHQLYRSRFRLLRGFSGLWLIHDVSA
ncbi:MAG TPA: hypothetical protein VND45_12755 [Thermoanaerobaculia bacterium]|jgi:hypothetical protein|nr:hypothetical protein [Thermoanaerobaculia bacterium]